MSLFRADPSRLPYLASGVHHLFFDNLEVNCTVEEGSQILSACVNVYDFAAIGGFSNPGILPILAQLHVKRLALCLEVLFDSKINMAHPFFATITHFDVFDSLEILTGENNVPLHELLPSLPALTHLCVNNEGAGPILAQLLERAPHLELLVVLRPAQQDAMEEGRHSMTDDRVVFGTFHGYWGQWKLGAAGSPNFWDHAAAVIEKRRAGAAQATVEPGTTRRLSMRATN